MLVSRALWVPIAAATVLVGVLVCTENLIRVDDVVESLKLAE